MSSWPASLPQKQFLGTSVGDDDSRVRSAMDAGPASVRKRFTAFTRPINVPMVLTGAQLQTFLTFYRTTINQGTDSFTWTDPVDDQAATYRFKTPPVWEVVAGGVVNDRLWKATLSLEILP